MGIVNVTSDSFSGDGIGDDALFARAVQAGAKVVRSPEDQFYGDRSFTVTDPDGHQWSFATNFEDFDPKKAPH